MRTQTGYLGIKGKARAESASTNEHLPRIEIIVHAKIIFEQTKLKLEIVFEVYEQCGSGEENRCRRRWVANGKQNWFMGNGRGWVKELAGKV